MKPLQLRTSLAVAYTAILSVVLTAVGIGFHSMFVRQFDGVITDRLGEKARALHRYLQFNEGTPVVAYDKADPEEAAFVNDATRYFQIFDGNTGRLLTQSPGMEALGLHYTPAEVAEFRARPEPRDIQTDAGRLRLWTSVISPAPNAAYVVQVGESLVTVDSALADFDRLLWIRIAVGLLIAILVGRWLAGRALAPLSRLALASQRIDIHNLHDRLAVRGAGDELDQVAQAFNQALARVEAAVGEMRQFSAALAHELRTPIAILRGEAELELAHPVSLEERRERLVSQIDEYDHLTRLINQILTLARAEAGEITLAEEPVALAALASSVTEQIETVAGAKNVALTCDAASDAAVRGDAGWLQRLLLILVDNAIRFTGEGGRVTVRVARTGQHALLSVSDTGIGIAPAAVPHVFERFYRADATTSQHGAGAGLGLALAKWIAEQHGGTITVTSRVGEGSTFVVQLPTLSGQ